MVWWWLSTERMTVAVGTDAEGMIRTAPPIVRRFMGQHVYDLAGWLSRQPGYRQVCLGYLEVPVGASGAGSR